MTVKGLKSQGVSRAAAFFRSSYSWDHSLMKSPEKADLLKCLCLIDRVGRREVDKLMYANILELETHLIGSETRINNQ